MSDPIEALCTVLLNIAKTSPSANINDVMAQVKSALDRNTKLTNALQTDTQMLQINLGQSKGYQVLVEGNATAYIGDRYELDTDAVIKALGKLLDEIALNQNPVGTPQNLPRSGVVEFVGRDIKLIELHEQLQNNKRIAIPAIAGMGGIGKTELALQYALEQLQQGQYPAGCCWLRARDREIATDIVTFAQVHLGLSLPDQLEIEDQVRFCWQRWPEGEALVVLDDVTDYQAIEPYLPPADPRFKLLITTRLDLGSTVQKVSLEELDEDGAIALLESLVGVERVRSQLADAQALCKWVGYLPLALELLGRFLAKKLDWSIDRLLKALDEERLAVKALVETENGMTGQLGVVAALELSWKELNEAEQELACLLGMFAIAPIPWSLVESCQSEVKPDDLEDIRDNGLMAHSLLKRVGDGSYQLHQIVQEYFRIKLGEMISGVASQHKNQGRSIQKAFCQMVVKTAERISEAHMIYQIEHVRVVIPHLEESIKQWLDIFTSDELIYLFVRIKDFYNEQGNYAVAENWCRECLKVSWQKSKKETSSNMTVISLANLASFCYDRGKQEESEYLFKQGIEMAKCLLKKNLFEEINLLISVMSNNLAALYDSQKKYHEAEPLYINSLSIALYFFQEDHPYIAAILNNLALIYDMQGKYSEAEILCRRVLKTLKSLPGKSHPDIPKALSNLALICGHQKKYKESKSLYQEALNILEFLRGDNHPDVAMVWNNLAQLHSDQGYHKEAELMYRKALGIYKRTLGEEHPNILIIQKNLGILYGFRPTSNKKNQEYA
jgi:tetratricopeptide (TPR) repeat protein